MFGLINCIPGLNMGYISDLPAVLSFQFSPCKIIIVSLYLSVNALSQKRNNVFAKYCQWEISSAISQTL